LRIEGLGNGTESGERFAKAKVKRQKAKVRWSCERFTKAKVMQEC